MSAELLPCPFCGVSRQDDEEADTSTAWLQVTTYATEFGVWCFGCRSGTGWFETRAGAVAAWNRRDMPRSLRP